eukprot:g2395.t1
MESYVANSDATMNRRPSNRPTSFLRQQLMQQEQIMQKEQLRKQEYQDNQNHGNLMQDRQTFENQQQHKHLQEQTTVPTTRSYKITPPLPISTVPFNPNNNPTSNDTSTILSSSTELSNRNNIDNYQEGKGTTEINILQSNNNNNTLPVNFQPSSWKERLELRKRGFDLRFQSPEKSPTSSNLYAVYQAKRNNESNGKANNSTSALKLSNFDGKKHLSSSLSPLSSSSNSTIPVSLCAIGDWYDDCFSSSSSENEDSGESENESATEGQTENEGVKANEGVQTNQGIQANGTNVESGQVPSSMRKLQKSKKKEKKKRKKKKKKHSRRKKGSRGSHCVVETTRRRSTTIDSPGKTILSSPNTSPINSGGSSRRTSSGPRGDTASVILQSVIDQINLALHKGVRPVAIKECAGGVYYFRNRRGRIIAVFKPLDEEPYAPNNPKGFVSAPRTKCVKNNHDSITNAGLDMNGNNTTKNSKEEDFVNNHRIHINDVPAMRSGIQAGEAGIREVVAFLLDQHRGGFSGVPLTALIVAHRSVFQKRKRKNRKKRGSHHSNETKTVSVPSLTSNSEKDSDTGSGVNSGVNSGLVSGGTGLKSGAILRSPLKSPSNTGCSGESTAERDIMDNTEGIIFHSPPSSPPSRQQRSDNFAIEHEDQFRLSPALGPSTVQSSSVVAQGLNSALSTEIGSPTSSALLSRELLDDCSSSVRSTSGETTASQQDVGALQEIMEDKTRGSEGQSAERQSAERQSTEIRRPSRSVASILGLLDNRNTNSPNDKDKMKSHHDVIHPTETQGKNENEHDGQAKVLKDIGTTGTVTSLEGTSERISSKSALNGTQHASQKQFSTSLPSPSFTSSQVPHTVKSLLSEPLSKVKVGSLQLYVPHECSAEDVGRSVNNLFPEHEVHKIGILDLHLLNLDRHEGNILVHTSSRPRFTKGFKNTRWLKILKRKARRHGRKCSIENRSSEENTSVNNEKERNLIAAKDGVGLDNEGSVINNDDQQLRRSGSPEASMMFAKMEPFRDTAAEHRSQRTNTRNSPYDRLSYDGRHENGGMENNDHVQSYNYQPFRHNGFGSSGLNSKSPNSGSAGRHKNNMNNNSSQPTQSIPIAPRRHHYSDHHNQQNGMMIMNTGGTTTNGRMLLKPDGMGIYHNNQMSSSATTSLLSCSLPGTSSFQQHGRHSGGGHSMAMAGFGSMFLGMDGTGRGATHGGMMPSSMDSGESSDTTLGGSSYHGSEGSSFNEDMLMSSSASSSSIMHHQRKGHQLMGSGTSSSHGRGTESSSKNPTSSTGSSRIVLTPIDHAYILPRSSQCDVSECSFGWMRWRQSREPFSKEAKEYIASLDVDENIRILKRTTHMNLAEQSAATEATTIDVLHYIRIALNRFGKQEVKDVDNGRVDSWSILGRLSRILGTDDQRMRIFMKHFREVLQEEL